VNIADRIRQLRVEHRWSQGKLAEKIGVHQKQVSAYERGLNIPSTEVLIRMAEVFNTTLDYLALEANGLNPKIDIQDRELLRRFEALNSLPEKDKMLAKELIDLLLLRNRFLDLAGLASGPEKDLPHEPLIIVG